ncbi:MAG: glycosyltransferase family 4 protein [Granulosicoccus sp.]
MDCKTNAQDQRSLLFFLYTLDGGGAERVASQLSSFWASNEVQVSLVTITGASSNDYLIDSRINRITLELDGTAKTPVGTIVSNLKRIIALRRVIRQKQPDVLLSFITEANIVAIFAAFLTGTRVVVSERGFAPYSSERKIWRVMRKLVYRFADNVTVQTSVVKDWIVAECAVKHINIVPNTVKLPLPAEEPVLQPQSVLPSNQKLILMVARLQVLKGIDRLIYAFADICSKHPDWSVVVCGAGPERDNLSAMIERLNLGHRVYLVGKVGNVQQWYERADVFALTSKSEGFPNALLEAMACGCAPVSFDCEAGPRDIVRDGVDGILVADQDNEELASALDRLMSNELLRAQFSTRAKDVLDRFNGETVIAQWESILWP